MNTEQIHLLMQWEYYTFIFDTTGFAKSDQCYFTLFIADWGGYMV